MNVYPMELSKPGIAPPIESVPYAKIAFRYANNRLKEQEYEAIRWLEDYLNVKRGELLLERHFFGQISIDMREQQFHYAPIIEEFFWELGIPLNGRRVWKEHIFPNSHKVVQIVLLYQTNIIGIVNERC